MIDPSEHTVAEVKAYVRDRDRDRDADAAKLWRLEQAERDGNDRVTLTEWLAERHDHEPDPDALTVDTDSPGDDHAPARVGAARADAWDEPTLGDPAYDPQSHYAFAPGDVPNPDDIPLVEVAPPHEGSFAGYWFTDGRPKVVARNKRVDRAIVDGPLEYRTDRPNAEEGETR